MAELDENARVALCVREYLADLYVSQPALASRLGVLDYGGSLPDMNRYAVDARLSRARAFLHAIDRLSVASMTPDCRMDCRMARCWVQREILWLERQRPFELQPHLYLEIALNSAVSLIAADGYPVRDRAEMLALRLHTLPEMLQQAQGTVCAASVRFQAIAERRARAFCALAGGALRGWVSQAPQPSLRARLEEGCCSSLQAVDEFVAAVRRLPVEPAQPAGAAREWLDCVLRVGHGFDEGSDALSQQAADELAEAREELRKLESAPPEGAANLPAESEALAKLAGEEVERALRFVCERGIADVTGDIPISLEAAPPWIAEFRGPLTYCPPTAICQDALARLFVRVPQLAQDSRSNPKSATATQGPARVHSPDQSRIRERLVDYGEDRTWTRADLALHAAACSYPGLHFQQEAFRAGSGPERRIFAFGVFTYGWGDHAVETLARAGYCDGRDAAAARWRRRLRAACAAQVEVSLLAGIVSPDESERRLHTEGGFTPGEAQSYVDTMLSTPCVALTDFAGRRALEALRVRFDRRFGAGALHRSALNRTAACGTIPPHLIAERLLTL